MRLMEPVFVDSVAQLEAPRRFLVGSSGVEPKGRFSTGGEIRRSVRTEASRARYGAFPNESRPIAVQGKKRHGEHPVRLGEIDLTCDN